MSTVVDTENMLTTRECKGCVHKNVCKFSKDFEKLSNEFKEKTKLIEYQNFTSKLECKFYSKVQPVPRTSIDIIGQKS